MKTSIALIIGFALIFIGANSRQTTLLKQSKNPCGEIPAFNKKILNFAQKNMGKPIGRGECWDVVAEALNSNHAKWDNHFVFGKAIDYKKDCVYPGDLIQLKDALMLDESVEGAIVYDEYPQHSAIILKVINQQEYILADQNFGIGKNKLNSHPINLKNLKRGSVQVYRPIQ